jgi:DNA-binding beta-propeller fold protein YncE
VRALVTAAVLLALAPGTAGARGIAQVRGAGGCVASSGARCDLFEAARQVDALAVSPDGRHVYATAFNADAVLWLARDRRTGTLRPLGCLSQRTNVGCSHATGLDQAEGLVLSSDGRDAYVAARASSTVMHLRRDPASGELTPAGCVGAAAASGCAVVEPLLGGVHSLTLTGDGRALVATAEIDPSPGREGDETGALVTLRRDPATGELAPAGCLVHGLFGCTGGDVLFDGPREPTPVTPDGFAYVTSHRGVQLVRIDPATAAPVLVGCFAEDTAGCTRLPAFVVDEDYGPLLTLSADGRQLYATAFFRGPAVLRWLRRDRGSGALRLSGCLGSARRGCRALRVPEEPFVVAPSPDGASVAVTDLGTSTVALLAREKRSGAVRPIAGRGGCVSDATDVEPAYPRTCGRGFRFRDAFALAWSPDSRFVYVGGVRSIAAMRVTGG